MKRTLVVLVAVVCVAACGQASVPKDPFVGTWRMNSGPRARFVISKNAGHYTVTQGFRGDKTYMRIAVFTRRGDQLVASWRVKNPFTGKHTGEVDTLKLSISHVPNQLLFTFSFGLPPSADSVTMTKLSDSTATPTPVP